MSQSRSNIHKKNICDNSIGTLSNQGGEIKGYYIVQCVLGKMIIRSVIHSQLCFGSDTTLLPRVCYQMAILVKDEFTSSKKAKSNR